MIRSFDRGSVRAAEVCTARSRPRACSCSGRSINAGALATRPRHSCLRRKADSRGAHEAEVTDVPGTARHEREDTTGRSARVGWARVDGCRPADSSATREASAARRAHAARLRHHPARDRCVRAGVGRGRRADAAAAREPGEARRADAARLSAHPARDGRIDAARVARARVAGAGVGHSGIARRRRAGPSHAAQARAASAADAAELAAAAAAGVFAAAVDAHRRIGETDVDGRAVRTARVARHAGVARRGVHRDERVTSRRIAHSARAATEGEQPTRDDEDGKRSGHRRSSYRRAQVEPRPSASTPVPEHSCFQYPQAIRTVAVSV